MDTTNIKVMRIIARLNVGGPAVHSDILSRSLYKEGFETILVTGTTEEGEASYEELFQTEPLNYRLVRLPKLRRMLSPLGDFKTFISLFQLMRKERPTIVHTHTAKAGMLGRLAAFFARVPIVVHTYHGHVLSGYFSPLVSGFFRGIERILATKTTALITLSPSLKVELSQKHRISHSSKFHIIPLGRDIDTFLNTPRAVGVLRRELKLLDPKMVLFGIMGRLVPIKNHILLFESLAMLETTVPWKLLVVGEGPLRASLEAEIDRLGISGHVLFLGWRADLANLYSDFDFSVLCSKNEGTPLTIIESFAAGCPFISTDVGGVKDMFTCERQIENLQLAKEGLLVPTEDIRALTAALKLFIEEKELRENCSAAARRAASFYTDQALTNRIGNLYRELIQENRRPCSDS